MKKMILIALTGAMLGCGGGGSSSGTDVRSATNAGGGGSAASPQGIWEGRTSTDRDFYLIVLDDKVYWSIYSIIGNNVVIGGAAQGTLQTTGNSFSSNNGRDFDLEAAEVKSLSASGDFSEKNRITGTIRYPNETVTFTGAYNPDYELTPSLNLIAGDYSGEGVTAAGNESAFFEIDSAGNVSGQGASGCSFSGKVVPRTRGNVFNLSITFGGGICIYGASTLQGIAYYDREEESLVAAGLNSGRTAGFIMLGSKSN